MPTPVNSPQPWTIALSAGTGDLETGTAVVTTRAPYALALTQLPRISVSTAPVGSVLTVDINAGATSPATILSTKLTIDAGEKTSVTASTPAVLSSTTMADNDIITFDIDGVGSGTAGVGLQVTLYVTRL
jgi:hypothetical protein